MNLIKNGVMLMNDIFRFLAEEDLKIDDIVSSVKGGYVRKRKIGDIPHGRIIKGGNKDEVVDVVSFITWTGLYIQTLIFDDITIIKGDDIERTKYRLQEIRKNIFNKKFEKRFGDEIELSPQHKAIFDYAVNYANKWEMYIKGEYKPTPIELDQFESEGLTIRLDKKGYIKSVKNVKKLPKQDKKPN